MRLSALISDYITYRRALGYRLTGEAFMLRAFSKSVGQCSVRALTEDNVSAYLHQQSASQQAVLRRHRALTGLYRYLEGHRGIRLPPLPRPPDPGTSDFTPYIYSRAEIQRLLRAAPTACKHSLTLLDEDTLRAVLLLIYGAGLRLGEAIRLNVGDVNLNQAVLVVRKTKFYKTRLVPLGKDLTTVLTSYRQRCDRGQTPLSTCPFFRLRNGKRIEKFVTEKRFRVLRTIAQVARRGGSRHQPRLHDLRHTAAVHRLIAWYRRGADLQRLLPRLATYLGHKDLSGTRHYLTLTEPLLNEASKRFERYAGVSRHG